MEKIGQTVGIGQVTLLAGADLKAWRRVTDGGLLPNIAPKPPGQHRQYARDDLIAVGVFRELRGLGIADTHAARIASDIRTVLRDSLDIEALYVVRQTDQAGAPRAVVTIRPGDSPVLVRFSIAKLREAADAVLDAAAR